jgi:hypothetical protein
VNNMEPRLCEICGADIPQHHNYCLKKECMIELTTRAGGVAYTPNNLPIMCFRADGLMLEHEHGDHPDYIFPVDVEYIAPLDEGHSKDYASITGKEGTPEEVRASCGETHALIYTNGSIAVTIYETCSAAWMLQEDKHGKMVAGACLGGHMWKAGEWKLSDESMKKIRDYLMEQLFSQTF